MSNLYIRGLGALTRVLIHEGRRGKRPSLSDLPQDARSEAQTTLPTTPPPTRGAVGLKQEGKKVAGTSCIPCATGHISTCSGLLAEALRFARSDGLGSEEVVSRLGLCQDEISAMERIDLRAEKVAELPPAEKELAHQVLVEVRGLRHNLENLADAQGLEDLTAKMQALRTQIGKEWWKLRLRSLPAEEKDRLRKMAQEKVETYLEGKENG